MEQFVFFLFAIGGIISGWMVISSVNPIHSILSLVLAFFNLSILLLILGIEFLPILFLIVYIGAIAILFLFVIMMLNIKLIEILDNTTRYVPIGFFIGLIFLWEIWLVFYKEILSLPLIFNENNNFFTTSNIEYLANVLYTEYFLFFIVGSLILLVAMIGAIILTISHEENIKRQDLFAQISTEYDKTIINKTC